MISFSGSSGQPNYGKDNVRRIREIQAKHKMRQMEMEAQRIEKLKPLKVEFNLFYGLRASEASLCYLSGYSKVQRQSHPQSSRLHARRLGYGERGQFHQVQLYACARQNRSFSAQECNE